MHRCSSLRSDKGFRSARARGKATPPRAAGLAKPCEQHPFNTSPSTQVTRISLREGSGAGQAGPRGRSRSRALTPHQPSAAPDSWGLLISSPPPSAFPPQTPAQAPSAGGTRAAQLLLLADNAIKQRIKRETTNWIHRSPRRPDGEKQGSDIISSSRPLRRPAGGSAFLRIVGVHQQTLPQEDASPPVANPRGHQRSPAAAAPAERGAAPQPAGSAGPACVSAVPSAKRNKKEAVPPSWGREPSAASTRRQRGPRAGAAGHPFPGCKGRSFPTHVSWIPLFPPAAAADPRRLSKAPLLVRTRTRSCDGLPSPPDCN